jgi:hypothetical protein
MMLSKNAIAAKLFYRNPFRDYIGLRPGRIDQGVDHACTSASMFYPLGRAVITIYRPVSGWPGDESPTGGGYIAYKLLRGPAKGRYVYFAENIILNKNLKVGSLVTRHTALGMQRPRFANCETGWARPSDNGYAPLAKDGYPTPDYFHEGDLTRAGVNFDRLIRLLGGPAATTSGRPIVGVLPKGFPRW